MKVFRNIKFNALLKKAWIIPMIFCAQVLSAQSTNQHVVDLPGGQMSYKAIFDAMEKQGNIWMGYATQDIDVFRTVSVPAGIYPVNDVLDWIFYNTNYEYTITGNHILISAKQSAVAELPADSTPVELILSPGVTSYNVRKPHIALKSNLLYDATTTINLGVEIGLAKRWTLDIPVNYNGWEGDTYFRHLGVQPEVRYWFCERFDGWFMGLHGHYAKFNVGGFPDWGIFSDNIKNNRYQGHLYGGGISAGYSFILKKRWSLEATVGVGYARIVYDKYPCVECGNSIPKEDKNYFGPTKVGLSLVFMIN